MFTQSLSSSNTHTFSSLIFTNVVEVFHLIVSFLHLHTQIINNGFSLVWSYLTWSQCLPHSHKEWLNWRLCVCRENDSSEIWVMYNVFEISIHFLASYRPALLNFAGCIPLNPGAKWIKIIYSYDEKLKLIYICCRKCNAQTSCTILIERMPLLHDRSGNNGMRSMSSYVLIYQDKNRLNTEARNKMSWWAILQNPVLFDYGQNLVIMEFHNELWSFIIEITARRISHRSP